MYTFKIIIIYTKKMTIIVFLIDTSASMMQRTYIGGRTTMLDVAKSAVETFVKIRQRSIDSRIDRYMLLTFEESPNNIKAGWKENLATFMNELKNLQALSLTTMGVAVKQAFDILNINRMTSGIDTYGQGRCPFFLETAVIVLIHKWWKNDYSKWSPRGIQFTYELAFPIGSEMTRGTISLDQRLFSLVLRLAGTPAIERDTGLVPSDSSPIDAMCEVTGGRSYCITSHRMLNQCIDSLVQKVQNGVVINFEKIGPDPPPPQCEKEEGKEEGSKEAEYETIERGGSSNAPVNTSWHNCRKMIYVPKTSKAYSVGYWPIPESFWPEVTVSVLPPRSAHPNIKFTCTNSEPLVIENLPFDKYELEPSPLTQYILSRKQPKTCWQVFVANSYKNSEVGHPFGYLKASTNLTCVNLFVMPYNYPVLLPLLDDLFKIHRWKPSNEWRAAFQNYTRTLPSYYAGPLRRALTRMGTPVALAQTLIPENSENGLSYSVSNYLKRLKNQAKVEYDKMCSEIIQRQTNMIAMRNNFNSPEQIRVTSKVLLKKELISHPLLVDKFTSQRDQVLEQAVSWTCTLDKERHNMSYKNPFDIPRNRLIQQVVRMRNNFLQSDWISLDQDSTHSLPICQMGNYQEYLKKQTPQLREIESAPVRQHMFGNPFKIDKRMMVDEADIDLVASPTGANRNNKRPNPSGDIIMRLPVKRKPGPLPKHFRYSRPSVDSTPPQSPVSSPLPSPVPWLNAIEKDLPRFDEVPSLIMNGLESPSASPMSERSRSPSPTHHMQDAPSYSVSEVNYSSRTNINYSYTAPNTIETITTNSLNDFYSSISATDDKQISQILKEANINHNSVSVNHTLIENKVKVEEEEEAVDDKGIETQNFETRKNLNRLVRKPGKNFSELFDCIKTLRGDIEAQVDVVKLVIKESLRFKRQHLASLLEEHIHNLLNIENK
ncbi:hypothetical protein NQ317_003962 [Molorchus minor]|uniref:Integrator complex subunit 6 n=1 Tax=Molorchus minor TaxID=1323400 RepID=A0ABQ9JH79_9CUCU|nr:hypothetical protein NQ317_003962 [Molorchus minor]